MKQVILLLKGEAPQVVNVGDDLNSLSWTLPNGKEVDMCIEFANIRSPSGEITGYLVATNNENITPDDIRDAAALITE